MKKQVVSEKQCKHEDSEHLCDNSPTSGGAFYWCPKCGALAMKDELTGKKIWRLVGQGEQAWMAFA